MKKVILIGIVLVGVLTATMLPSRATIIQGNENMLSKMVTKSNHNAGPLSRFFDVRF